MLSLSVSIAGGDVVFSSGRRLTLSTVPREVVAHSGDLVVLHGDNGCGKSTLLKSFSGIFGHFQDKTSQPAVSVKAKWSTGGISAEIVPRITRNDRDRGLVTCGYLAQSVRSNVFCRSVESELVFSLEHSGHLSDATLKRLRESVDEMEKLGMSAEESPHSLSKGRQQVLGIQSLILPSPDALFLDEPSAALDARALDWLVSKLFQVLRNGDVKIVFVATQDGRLLSSLEGRPSVHFVHVSGNLHEDAWRVPSVKETGGQYGYDLELMDISSSWGAFQVDLPTTVIRPGEALLISGPNGSGKSTLLKTIAGFKRGASGVLKYGRFTVRAGRSGCSRFVSFAFQNAEEQIAFHRAGRELLYPVKTSGWNEYVRPSVGNSGINPDISPWHLSFGQRKLLTYYSLAFSSPVLIVDEPFASLDPNHRLRVAQIFRDYVSVGGILIATASREHEEFKVLPVLRTQPLE